MALKADRFMEAACAQLEPLRGTMIYDQVMRDLRAKTEQVDEGYARWLSALLSWLGAECGLDRPLRVLDFGCGSGELAVLMNSLGYEAFGVDLHTDHLRLARILATENGVPQERFVLSDGGPLPFADGAFDLVTMDSVLEHLSDETLERVLPELSRVCSSVIFVLVPNCFKTRDDHTGLPLLPLLPHWLGALLVKASGPFHQYGISRDGSWDVHYRRLGAIRRHFARHGFEVGFVPDALVFPPLAEARPLFEPTAGAPWKRALRMPVHLAIRLLLLLGIPRQAFYPYLNLVVRPRRGPEGGRKRATTPLRS